MMRTTLTLEEEIAEAVEAHRRDHGLSLKRAINQLLRAGLRHYQTQEFEARPYRTETRALKLRAGIDPAKLTDLLDELEVDDARRRLDG